MCSCSQLNIPRALSDFQREPGFKSAWPNFPKVVCLIPVHSLRWFSGLQPWPQSAAGYQGSLLRLALSLNNQLRKQMTHGGDTLSCPGRVCFRCPSLQLPLSLTDKHWRRDPTSSLLWTAITAPPPSLVTTSVVCSLTPLLLLNSHTLLCCSCMSRPPPTQPPALPYEHGLCLRRQASEECVVIAQALKTQMFSLWFGLYSDLLFHIRNYTLTLQLHVSEESWWWQPSLLLCYSRFFYTELCILHPVPLPRQSGTSSSGSIDYICLWGH